MSSDASAKTSPGTPWIASWVPSERTARYLAENFGYSMVTLVLAFRNEKGEPEWHGSRDYRGSRQRVVLCSKRTDLSRLAHGVESA